MHRPELERKPSAALAALVLALILGLGPAAHAQSKSYFLSVDDAVAAEGGGAYLGVRLTEETDHPDGGARITNVVDETPAAEAGLEAGDVVVEFDGETIRGPLALTKRIHAHEPGDRVTVRVLRDGRERTVEVELGERSQLLSVVPEATWDVQRWQEAQENLDERLQDLSQRYEYYVAPDVQGRVFTLGWDKPKLGVQLVETTVELREHLGGGEDEGVLVSKVLSGTPAERAGIHVGDLILSIDGDPVHSVGQLREALDGKEGTTFPVRVARGGRTTTVEVTIPGPDDDRPTGPRALLMLPPPPDAPLPPDPRVPVVRAVPAPAPPARPVPPARPAPPAPPAPPVRRVSSV
jgi:C-terminal processing protease CtpA/Prc